MRCSRWRSGRCRATASCSRATTPTPAATSGARPGRRCAGTRARSRPAMPGSRPRGRWPRSSGAPGPAHEAGDAALRAEFVRIAGESDSVLFHDTLAEPNEPVWFHAFVEHAGRHGLTYVAEALPSMMAGGGLAPRVREFLASRDRLAREQYLDFARVRRFRQSLLCRSEAAGDFQLSPARLAGLFASASLQLLRAAADGRLPAVAAPEGDSPASIVRDAGRVRARRAGDARSPRTPAFVRTARTVRAPSKRSCSTAGSRASCNCTPARRVLQSQPRRARARRASRAGRPVDATP